ncbi:MAG: ATP-grasp domain-containing protein [Elusimicrobia bacterium]|nr:ATP-grasp domain-containing protein [Elusimicrobiota bacterium]MDY6039839.1 ATP-grasp domain-containing protein [Elusimicrobiaceae bacterium]
MIKILLLSAGTNAIYHLTRIFKEKFPQQFYLFGVDVNPRHLLPSCHNLDGFCQVPYTSDPNYYQTILNICRNEQINVILPSFDSDQKLFYPGNTDLQKLNVFSLGTPKDSLAYYENKTLMNAFLQLHGLPVPAQYTEAKEGKEYFLKPKYGVGSIGTQKISGQDFNALPNKEDFLLQEICKGPEITLECFAYQGNFSCAARERIATKAGVCTKTRVYYDENLKQIGLNFIKRIKTPLYFNLQFMTNSHGEAVITDVNFRLAGGMSLTCAAGWDEATALANVLLERPTKEIFKTLQPVQQEQYVVRCYQDIVTHKPIPSIAFDLDGTLLDSRLRHKKVLDDILVRHKIRLDSSELLAFKRKGHNNIDFLIHKGITKEQAQDIQKEWISLIEDDSYLKLDALYEDALQLLQSYHGTRLILITARNRKDAALAQIRRMGIASFFQTIHIVPSSPTVAQDKAYFLKKENAVLMLGDTKADFTAAQLAGIPFKHLNHGFHDASILNI